MSLLPLELFIRLLRFMMELVDAVGPPAVAGGTTAAAVEGDAERLPVGLLLLVLGLARSGRSDDDTAEAADDGALGATIDGSVGPGCDAAGAPWYGAGGYCDDDDDDE
jgi:hypothetical protein